MHRLKIDLGRTASGPDGKGWNRISIIPMDPLDRCALLPQTRQAALDTLRGMAAFGVTTAYLPCTGPASCNSCNKTTAPKDPWNAMWHIREDSQGMVWLLGDIAKAFAGFGYAYKSWRALMASVEVPPLTRKIDETGAYWIASA